jgi:modulator of FtsH protease HflK
MPSQNGNGSRRGPWGSGAKSGSDLEDLVRQGQDRLNQIMPSGGLRPVIVLAVLALVGLGAWTAFYTMPSDSVAVVQRFRRDCILSCRWALMWQQSFLSNGS